jgi:Putative zinc-finger
MTHQHAVSTFASERYLLDEMTEPERATFEEHYFSCAECAEDLRLGALMREGTRAGFLEGARLEGPVHAGALETSGGIARRPWYQSAVVPWALAATLALVAGYDTLIQVPSLRRGQTGPLALAPVTLRPATRGQEPVVSIGRDTPVVTFAVDVRSAAPGAKLSYDLRTAAGAPVASGLVPAPASGPLLLLVPARAIGTPGHYVLTAADSEYRFEVVTP